MNKMLHTNNVQVMHMFPCNDEMSKRLLHKQRQNVVYFKELCCKIIAIQFHPLDYTFHSYPLMFVFE